MKFWPLNSYYKRSDSKVWLAEDFLKLKKLSFEIKKKIHVAEAYRNGVKLNYVHPHMALSKIFNRSI